MSILYSTLNRLFSAYFKIAYKHRVYGVQYVIEAQDGCIIASNHISFLDPPMIAASVPFPIYFLARSSLFQGKFFSSLLSSLNAIPLTKQIEHQAFKKVGKGYTVVIFPEGTRSQDGELEHFNVGVALLAKTLKKPVIPTYIDGAYEAWPRKHKFPRLQGKTFLAFGPPLYLADFNEGTKKEQYRAFTDALEKNIIDLKMRYSEK